MLRGILNPRIAVLQATLVVFSVFRTPDNESPMQGCVGFEARFATFDATFFALSPTIARIGSRLRKTPDFFPISGNYFELSVDRFL
jgi:hypothetical protein